MLWKPRRVGVVVCLGTGSMALPLAAMAATVPLVVLAAATGAAGCGLALSMTTWAGLVQQRIPKDRLSRTLSYSALGQILPVPIGYLAAGPLSRHLGLRPTLALGALVIAAAAVVPLAVRQIRALSLADEEPETRGELVTKWKARATSTAPAKSRKARSRAAASRVAPSVPGTSPQRAVRWRAIRSGSRWAIEWRGSAASAAVFVRNASVTAAAVAAGWSPTSSAASPQVDGHTDQAPSRRAERAMMWVSASGGKSSVSCG